MNASNNTWKNCSSSESCTNYLTAFHMVNWAYLSVTTWIFICVIGYGARTKRWTRIAGSRSLCNGPVYVLLTLIAATMIAKAIATEIMYNLPKIANTTKSCEIINDIDSTIGIIICYLIYVFLIIRQIFIFKHPFMKEQIGNCSVITGYVILILLTIIYLVMFLATILPKNHIYTSYGCFYLGDNNLSEQEYGFIYFGAMIQNRILVIGMCVYSIFAVKSLKPGNKSDVG